MNPKEKAKELAEKMHQSQGYDTLTEDGEQIKERAKQCALIAVEEIISFCEEITMENGGFIFKQYWQEVKNEIENL